MAIEMDCPHCGRECSLADWQLGKAVRCKGCEDTFLVEERRRASTRRGRDEDSDAGCPDNNRTRERVPPPGPEAWDPS